MLGGCKVGNSGKVETTVLLDNQVLRYSESTYMLGDGTLLVANFGSDVLDPLNKEGKGYIVAYKDGKSQPFIKSDGHLSAPRGMAVNGNSLYVCDVNKVVIYNMDSLAASPLDVMLPEGEACVNDIVVLGGSAYVTVTTTGNLYKLKVGYTDAPTDTLPVRWCNVPGANGIATDGERLYVASHPTGDVAGAENGIYVISDMANPQPELLVTVSGKYDGIAVSPDKKHLFVSNWEPSGIYKIDLTVTEKRPVKIELGREISGPADFTLHNDTLYIPDLPASNVVAVSLGK